MKNAKEQMIETMIETKKKASTDYSSSVRRWLQGSEDDPISKPLAGLYVIATPIGNLGDITLRALHALAGVDVVACEDTRVTGALLHRYGIRKPLLAYHDHNAQERLPEVLARLGAGESVALVSDAGTPLVSDPGYRLVRACREQGYPVTALPGASAVLTALACAGLPTDRFLFVGFLPAKKAGKTKALEALRELEATLVFYESPKRLAETLETMLACFGPQRQGVVARELTKLFEEMRGGSLEELTAHYRQAPEPKGEVVLLLEPGTRAPCEGEEADQNLEALLTAALSRMSVRDAVALAVERTGLSKSKVYARALTLARSLAQLKAVADE